MQRIELRRLSESLKCTTGVFIDIGSGLPFCLSLELPWLENKTSLSCIPVGIYRCRPKRSAKFNNDLYSGFEQYNCFEVLDVPGRTDILIHPGNTTDDIVGCICPGTFYGEFKDKPAVLSSKTAFQVLVDLVGIQPFDLIIF